VTDAGNEQHLALLLQSFNKNIYLNYLEKIHRIISICAEDSSYSSINIIKNADGIGNLAFKISFDFPVYISLSHPICRFRSHRNYPIRERTFIANLGLVPVFFSSLNLMTVLKLWGDRAQSFFNPSNSPLADTETRCWELPEASRSAEYSSMNFILQNNSEPEDAGSRINEIYEKYFRLGFWSFPRKGFSTSTHFLHGRAKISSQVKVAKSLYIIKEIESKSQKFEMEGRTIDAVNVKLAGLVEKEGNYFFAYFPAFIDSEIASKIPRDKIGTSFVNGLVAEVIQPKKPKLSIMTIIADYGESYYDILSSLIGIVADRKYSLTEAVADIGPVDELQEDVFNLYLDLYRKLNVSRTLSESVSNLFDVALNSMFPIIITDEHRVLMIHPIVWGFLKKWNLIAQNDTEQKEILIHLVKLMDSSQKRGFSKMFLNDSAEFFSKRGINKFRFTRSLPRLSQDIRLCKMLRKVLEFSEENYA